MKLTTDRLIVRSLELKDADALFRLLSDKEVMRFSVVGPLSFAQVQEYLEKRVLPQQKEHGFSLCAVEERQSGQMIGCAGLMPQTIDEEPLVELGYRLHTAFWGQGFATEAGSALLRYAFDVLQLNQVISIIEPENKKSLHVALRLGMSFWKKTTFRHLSVEVWQALRKMTPI